MTISISWEGLSERGQAILRLVGTPLSQGYSERELAKELGTTTHWVCDRLDELQAELRQLGEA
jgi:hypothetical protein